MYYIQNAKSTTIKSASLNSRLPTIWSSSSFFNHGKLLSRNHRPSCDGVEWGKYYCFLKSFNHTKLNWTDWLTKLSTKSRKRWSRKTRIFYWTFEQENTDSPMVFFFPFWKKTIFPNRNHWDVCYSPLRKLYRQNPFNCLLKLFQKK